MIRIKYQLYKETDNNLNALQQILYNRGIPIEQQETWLSASWPQINDWRLLDRMEDAVNRVYTAIHNNEQVQIVVDPDVDGFTSAAILTNYLYTLYPDWVHFNLSHIMHKDKAHGLSDVVGLINCDLLIIPDAGRFAA